MKILTLISFLLLSTIGFSQEYYLFTGTYTNGKSQGIYVYNFDVTRGEIKPVSITEGVENPSYLALAPGGKQLYSVNENGGEKKGGISSFKFDSSTGNLQLLNSQLSAGDHPCYVSVDKTGRWVIVGNYSGGNLAVLRILPDGSLQPAAQVIQHTGKSVNQSRQEKAHVHAVVFSPDNKYLLVPDLGLDKLMIYQFDASAEKPLSEKPFSYVNTRPGNGPRHVVFHPTKPFVYLMEELSGTVCAYQYKNGRLLPVQNINSHSESFTGEKGSADIHVSPDGKFLYTSNRGDANTITVYAIDNNTGMLRIRGFQSSGGVRPRNFVIDPTGNYLLVANQDSDNVVVFKRNSKTGLLASTGISFTVPSPVCLKFLKKN